jgi:hypothetical protein
MSRRKSAVPSKNGRRQESKSRKQAIAIGLSETAAITMARSGVRWLHHAGRSCSLRLAMGSHRLPFSPSFDSGPIKRVPDDELAWLAEEAGPDSAAAAILRQLKASRTKDRQYFAFHVNEYFFVGPVPDAETEAELLALADLLEIDTPQA